MLNALRPTKLKLIIALVVAVLAFVASELSVASKEKIWASVHPVITKEALIDLVPDEGAVSFESTGREIAPVSQVETTDIKRTLWQERAIRLLIFIVTGYLGSCIIVRIARASNEI